MKRNPYFNGSLNGSIQFDVQLLPTRFGLKRVNVGPEPQPCWIIIAGNSKDDVLKLTFGAIFEIINFHCFGQIPRFFLKLKVLILCFKDFSVTDLSKRVYSEMIINPNP